MTEQPDTTAIRALWPDLDPDLDACVTINRLCDALDAARTQLRLDATQIDAAADLAVELAKADAHLVRVIQERDAARVDYDEAYSVGLSWQHRAEAAEAELARRDAAIVAGQNAAINRQENGL